VAAKKPFTVIAHRGARADGVPENTLAAFARALEIGATWIELDVQWHAGHLWVLHDLRLERCTDGSGRLADRSVAELERLRVRGGDHPIPRLPEVLALIDRRAKVNIELKTANGTAAAVARVLRACLKAGWRADDFLVSSFHHPELRIFRKLLPKVPVGLVEAGVPLNLAAAATRLGAKALSMALAFPEPRLVRDAHRRGLKVYVYTVNAPDDLARMRALGVDGVFTDFPDRALKQ
jgi:glycerophosphoryl diester phosphodiesterase